jgi:SAM-dependent methyltransferase
LNTVLQEAGGAYGSWDNEYARATLTDWEQIPVADLSDVLLHIGPPLGEVTSAAEIGCGRGLRSLAMLNRIEELDRSDFRVWGVDQSGVAIDAARSLRSKLIAGRSLECPYEKTIERWIGPQASVRSSRVEFVHADLFGWLPEQKRTFDLVIDWMCFHEVDEQRWAEYSQAVARVCSRHFVVNLFSKEGSSLQDLGEVAGMRKYQFSEADVREIFGRWFDIEHFVEFPEALHPEPPPSDGIVAAKRAYVMVRRTH